MPGLFRQLSWLSLTLIGTEQPCVVRKTFPCRWNMFSWIYFAFSVTVDSSSGCVINLPPECSEPLIIASSPSLFLPCTFPLLKVPMDWKVWRRFNLYVMEMMAFVYREEKLQLLDISNLLYFFYQRYSPPFFPVLILWFIGNHQELLLVDGSGKQRLLPQLSFTVAKPE